MQKDFKENNLKPYAVKSANTRGRLFNEKEHNECFYIYIKCKYNIK